jgi:hypothetical protein
VCCTIDLRRCFELLFVAVGVLMSVAVGAKLQTSHNCCTPAFQGSAALMRIRHCLMLLLIYCTLLFYVVLVHNPGSCDLDGTTGSSSTVWRQLVRGLAVTSALLLGTAYTHSSVYGYNMHVGVLCNARDCGLTFGESPFVKSTVVCCG